MCSEVSHSHVYLISPVFQNFALPFWKLSLHASNSPLFKTDFTCHKCSSTSCALVAYYTIRDIGIFNGKSVLLDNL